MCIWSLFSKCFEFSCIPSSWSKAIISPIPKCKNRDPYVPLNKRGISLLCCISKLYLSLLNNRLTTYFDTLNLFPDFQNGLRKNRSCEDHAYVLSTVLRNRVLSGKPTFVSFIDFEKAFDWIPRDLLLYKLLSYYVDGNFYNAINLCRAYSNTTSSVKLNNIFTKWFDTTTGVRQGDTWTLLSTREPTHMTIKNEIFEMTSPVHQSSLKS